MSKRSRRTSRRPWNRRWRPLRRSTAGDDRRLFIEALEARMLLAVGPQLVGVNPNNGELLRNGDVRNLAPTDLTFRFDENQVIDPVSVGGIRLIRSGHDGQFGDGNDVVIVPGFLGIGDASNEVVMRFAEALPDDVYRIDITGSGPTPLRNVEGDPFNNGIDRSIQFRLNLAPQVIAVVPQPVTRDPVSGGLRQARNQIVVYFNDDPLLDSPQNAENPAFYQLIFTNDTVETTDDTRFLPTTVAYDSNTNTAVLTFARDLEQLPSASQRQPTSRGTFRLRIGTSEALPSVPVEVRPQEDAGSSLATAFDLGLLTRQNQIVHSSIDPQPWNVIFPGGMDEPGHREIPDVENHLAGADTTPGVTRMAYNFQIVYGKDPLGNNLFNLITENQRQRAREIFELYGAYLGIDFYETADEGITVVTGDMRALDPDVPTGPGGVAGLAGGTLAIMDAGESWDDSYGGSWFQTAMHEIGHLLGYGHTYDLPPITIMGSDPLQAYGTVPEPIFPGLADRVHGQYLHRPDSIDIDIYQFEVTERGVLSVETIAERLADSSSLDTVLRLYRADGTLLSQNDDYFSEDSLISLSLDPGTYYIGVSSTGNDAYDALRENTGAGGTSQGNYDLRLHFLPEANSVLVDATGVALDGDGSGEPGGVFNFWFQAKPASQTVYVDKMASGGGNGSLASPYNRLATALAASRAGDVVRIVGNGGADGDLSTLGDNRPYEIGRNQFGVLPDGDSFAVPKDVTVMIDAGAIFKLRAAAFRVGSDAVQVDRSGGALQVLGTPAAQVIFTSYHDESVGIDTDPLPTSPSPGDWGGLIFQNRVDRGVDRFEYEAEGEFLNYVNHADIRYGGGNVTINSVRQVINPIHVVSARPTITDNVIAHSADAAISANPNSFEESNFHALDSLRSDYQEVPFSADYSRVGPEIHRNRLVDNTINGLFVRIDTPAGGRLERMTVSGRFDDTDIVYVLKENLVIDGDPGGPIRHPATGALVARPDAQLTIDPGIVVKSDGARIEVGIGAQLLAEGHDGQEVIFTSIRDDRFGAGGTFETSLPGADMDRPPTPGDWGGIFAWPVSRVSLDHGRVAYGGGLTRVEGSFAGFNALGFYQTESARVANTVLEFNDSGRLGQGAADRGGGRGDNDKAVIFVRGAQPVIINSVIHSSSGPGTAAISIDVNSLGHEELTDFGRSTGLVDVFTGRRDNQGPLLSGIVLDDNPINGMVVRGGVVTTESIWDDTDIVHVLYDEVIVPNFHTFGGVRLESSADASLVVKLRGATAGFTTTGRPLDIQDRIGGTFQAVGQPGKPVILTSLGDDTVGAGFDRQGLPQNDTDNGGRPLRSQPAGSFQIDLNFGPIIKARPDLMKAIEMAARTWEELIQDPITVVLDIEMAQLTDGLLGVTSSQSVDAPYETVRSRLIGDAANRPTEAIVNELPTFQSLQDHVVLPDEPANPFVLSRDMSINRANAKALGIPVNTPGAVASQYDPSEQLDARIEFNLEPIAYLGDGRPVLFDYDPTDGTLLDRYDLTSVAIHEIGHALGFVSTVDDIDAAMADATLPRDVQMNTLDLFRLEPGRGAVDFADSPRILDPRVSQQVLYDGGFFDSFGIDYAGITVGDIPVSRGSNFGDASQASHWADLPNQRLGMMTPGLLPNFQDTISEAERQMFDLIGYDIVGGPIAGDWRSIQFETYTNDTNMGVVVEAESVDEVAPGTNATTDSAEFLGDLAPDPKAGDENRRLGFEVHGVLNQPADVDLYSFNARSGTRIWIDIDRTTSSLDTVVELVDASGEVLARSDNSLAEYQGTEDIFAAAGIIARPLPKSPQRTTDFWSTNTADAGMSVILPGGVGTTNTYHIRVRSSSEDLDDLAAGQSAGVYQMQIRLQDVDQKPGTTIRMADVRYAIDGIRVRGVPRNSPLVGEVREDESNNDTTPAGDNYRGLERAVDSADFVGPQNIGNILTTSLGSVSISGDLSSATDVDLYLFQVGYEDTQDIPGFTAERFADLIFDVDYADGLARPDTSISVFQAMNVAAGQTAPGITDVALGPLVYSSEFGGDRDDLPSPLSGSDLDDLSRGSAGLGDPFLGPVRVPEGFYILAISGSSFSPAQLREQFDDRLPINPFVRLEPADSMVRVVQTNFDFTPTNEPLVPNFLSANSAVPFHLGDVVLFVSRPPEDAADPGTLIYTVDPFTGSQETLVGAIDLTVDDPNDPGGGGGDDEPARQLLIGDLAMRDDGLLFAYTFGTTDQDSGNYLQISPADATAIGVGTDGELTDDLIETYHPDVAAAPTQVNATDVGVQFEAMTIVSTNSPRQPYRGYAIGHRDMGGVDPPPDVPLDNILYFFDPQTGEALSDPDADRDNQAVDVVAAGTAWTQIVERGVLDTSTGGGGVLTGMAFIDDQLFAVSDQGGLFEIMDYDEPAGASARFIRRVGPIHFSGLAAGPPTLENGRFRSVLFGIADNGDIHAFDTSGQLQKVFADGTSVIHTGLEDANGLAFSTLDRNLWHITDNRADQIGHGRKPLANPSDALLDQMVEEGLLHPTERLIGERLGAPCANASQSYMCFGGQSMHFGEAFDDPQGNDNYDLPGGAHGTLVSAPFSLEGIAKADAPVLYFNYFLATEQAAPQFNPLTNQWVQPMRDAFRVYVSDDSADEGRGVWHLLATSDPMDAEHDFTYQDDGFSFDANPDDGIDVDVQRLWDNSWQDVPRLRRPGNDPDPTEPDQNIGPNGIRDRYPFRADDDSIPFPGDDENRNFPELDERVGVWRQARIDLSPFVGSDNLRLRFDFSTAASFDLGKIGGVELKTVAGSQLLDGDTVVIDGQTFEFDLGPSVAVAAGHSYADGDYLDIVTPQGRWVVEVDTDGAFQPKIALTDASQLADGQTVTLAYQGQVLILELDTDGTVDPANTAVPFTAGDSVETIAQALAAAINDADLGVGATADAGSVVLDQSDAILASTGAGITRYVPLPVAADESAQVISDRLELTILSAGIGGVVSFAHDGLVNLKGAQTVGVPAESAFRVIGEAGAEGIRIDVQAGMSARQVAQAMIGPLAQTFTGGVTEVIKTFDNIVRLFDHPVQDPGPLGLADFLTGDNWGAFSNLPRGVVLLAPAGTAVRDGQTFTLSDGTNDVIFEFDALPDANGVQPGNVAVPFDFADTGADMAIRIRDAVNQAVQQGLLDVLATSNSGSYTVSADYSNRVPILGDNIPNPLGIAFTNSVPRQPLGALRGQNNTSELHDYNGNGELDADDDEFEILFEGVYVDDVIIGFAGRGENVVDHRILYPYDVNDPLDQNGNIDYNRDNPPRRPNIFQNAGFVAVPSEDTVQAGKYEIEIRRADPNTPPLHPGDRVSEGVTLLAPSGVTLVDGRHFTLSDGLRQVVFEFEEVSTANGVEQGHRAIPFQLTDTPSDVAARIRDAINDTNRFGLLDIRAASASGSTSGPGDGTNRVNLFGNAFVLEESAPHGIDFLVSDSYGGGNVPRTQGQLIISDNQISHSARFGVVVEDTERDLPDYTFFDPNKQLLHSQFSTGDYTPQPGPVRNLSEDNASALAPGVTIANNVIALGGEGGIHYGGDAGGVVLVAPLGIEPPDPQVVPDEVYDGPLFTFDITDHNGLTQRFEFDYQGQGVQPGNIPVVFNDPLPFPRYSGIGTDMADSLEEAIESSPLDVTVYRTYDELYIEGATLFEGTSPAQGWMDPFHFTVQQALVPFGRIVNNTIVGRGGRLTDERAVQIPGQQTPKIINDFNDVGVLIEDNASPTLLNNIFVNLETAIAADNTGKTSVIGGSLYQGNVRATRNITPGDFAITVPDTAPLFVDFAGGNYYPAPNSRIIDSSVDSLEDRPALVTVKQPHGIARSPILAPSHDAFGQLRVDDPAIEPPSGLGSNIFKDRGALDRADFVGPTANLINPRDNDAGGVDRNRQPSVVEIGGTTLTHFSIQFSDGFQVGTTGDGTGVAPSTVTPDRLRITQDGQTLQLGIDYSFSFDATNNILRLTPLAGIFPNGSTYVITILDGVRDIAGNPLQANQTGGGVQFTVRAFVGADFGDVPDPPYPTLAAHNGAQHTIEDGFFLGGSVTADSDGQPGPNAIKDFGDDGVVWPPSIERGQTIELTVTASQPGMLDAWIDFNGDGDWSDSGEQIFVRRALVAGANTLDVSIPATATAGLTFARFRLSHDGGLAPTGPAPDGEVEDYGLTILSSNTWQNPDNPLDVTGDGAVSPLDAVRVINELNAPQFADPATGKLPPAPSPLPNPPGFVDVTGDGFVSPLDAIQVINALNAAARAQRAALAAPPEIVSAAPPPLDHHAQAAAVAALYGPAPAGSQATGAPQAAPRGADPPVVPRAQAVDLALQADRWWAAGPASDEPEEAEDPEPSDLDPHLDALFERLGADDLGLWA